MTRFTFFDRALCAVLGHSDDPPTRVEWSCIEAREVHHTCACCGRTIIVREPAGPSELMMTRSAS